MVGPASTIESVPLREVLPSVLASATDEVRRLAVRLEAHCPNRARVAWHWYPAHRQTPPSPSPRTYLLLVDTTITLYTTSDDWLELTLDIAWRSGPVLTVNAAVEVACWCPTNRNTHQVRAASWQPETDRDLIDTFAAGVLMLTDVLRGGPFEPGPWRAEAGLPDAPQANS